MNISVDNKPRVIRPAVVEALARWREQQAVANGEKDAQHFPPAEEIFQSLPRREQIIAPGEGQQAIIPIFEPLAFETTFWQSVRRLLTWLGLFTRLILGNFADRLRGRDSVERRAVRLRQRLEQAGGTFVKFGQQLAMRIDLIPWAYSVELSKMLDKMPPFPLEEALATIERTTGQPWQETFAVFDPQPIGSASVACVYQAILKDGSKVAVKVRRPNIGALFMADFRVIDWFAELGEFLTIVRPGTTRNLRAEFRATLLEELDFRREGRFQDTFRRNAPESGKDYFTAPKVYFEYSSSDVIVQEFVSGLWLWEVIAIVERGDPAGRALLRKLNIDPQKVAKRILWAAFWSMDENLFFHGDPHPANILIRPNSELTFIDFGSCGSFNASQLNALEKLVLGMQSQDAEAMVRASLSLLEPLPPVDLPTLMKEFEGEYMAVLHTFNTPAEYTEWWERTTARQWLAMIRVARKYNLPVNLHMLRMIRATLLYDTLVLRLDPEVDRYYEYTQFMKDRAKLVKKRWRRRVRENAGDAFYLRMEELAEAGEDLLLRAQNMMSRPIVRLGPTVDKWVYAASVLSRMAWRVLIVSLLAIGLVSIRRYGAGEPVAMLPVLQAVATNTLYQLFLVAATVLNVRLILFRLRDRDAGNNRRFYSTGS